MTNKLKTMGAIAFVFVCGIVAGTYFNNADNPIIEQSVANDRSRLKQVNGANGLQAIDLPGGTLFLKEMHRGHTRLASAISMHYVEDVWYDEASDKFTNRRP